NCYTDPMPSAFRFLPLRIETRHTTPLELTPRDLTLLEAVYRYRMLEGQQVEALFFSTPGKPNSRARARLRRLYQHGFLKRVERPIYRHRPNPSPVYRLGKRGAELLARERGIPLSQLRYWGKGDDRDHHPTAVSHPFLAHG